MEPIEPDPDGPFAPTWESLRAHRTPDWYVDAKFGVFIHWGVYSVPAFGNEWYARNMYLEGSDEHAHHLQTYGPHARFGYKDFVPMFRAERFDPDAWIALFRRAGAKYVVPVAEHHDGFAMYDTALSRWNAAKMGPCRDVIGELADAARRQGMVFGVSSHRAEHWWFQHGGMRFDSDVRDPANLDLYGPAQPVELVPQADFLDDWYARTCELVDRYRPQLVWFDWWIEEPVFAPYLQRFAARYYNRGHAWNRGVAINYKHHAFPDGTAVFDLERGQTRDIRPDFWQTDTSVARNSWSYTVGNDYKDPLDILGDLADVVSKNGALLLNVGPKADGTIPDEDRAILETIGDWLSVNGEAIYATRPWKVFGEGPTEVAEGQFTDTQRGAFTPHDIRFTTRGETLYAISLGPSGTGEVAIRSLGTHLRLLPRTISKVELLAPGLGSLGTAAGVPARWRRDADALHVALPDTRPVPGPVVWRIACTD